MTTLQDEGIMCERLISNYMSPCMIGKPNLDTVPVHFCTKILLITLWWTKHCLSFIRTINSMHFSLLPPFIYLLHLSKKILFKNILHISLGLAYIHCPFVAYWLPFACIYCLFVAHWLFLGYHSSCALSSRWLNAEWVLLFCSLAIGYHSSYALLGYHKF
jgi:hypothetical protein